MKKIQEIYYKIKEESKNHDALIGYTVKDKEENVRLNLTVLVDFNNDKESIKTLEEISKKEGFMFFNASEEATKWFNNNTEIIDQNKDKHLRKEYEKYAKTITDNFIKFQMDTPTNYRIEWNGGIHFDIINNTSLALDGATPEEIKKHNAKMAIKYVKANMLTFEEWLEKHNQQT